MGSMRARSKLSNTLPAMGVVSGFWVSVMSMRCVPVKPAVDHDRVTPSWVWERSMTPSWSQALSIGSIPPGPGPLLTGVNMTGLQAGPAWALSGAGVAADDAAQFV